MMSVINVVPAVTDAEFDIPKLRSEKYSQIV